MLVRSFAAWARCLSLTVWMSSTGTCWAGGCPSASAITAASMAGPKSNLMCAIRGGYCLLYRLWDGYVTVFSFLLISDSFYLYCAAFLD